MFKFLFFFKFADRLLIEEVRNHEILYAVSTKSNKDNQLRDTAWNEIADTLGKSGIFCCPCCWLTASNFRPHYNLADDSFVCFRCPYSGRTERTLALHERSLR